jgi:autotransporter-associated beta strand protein
MLRVKKALVLGGAVGLLGCAAQARGAALTWDLVDDGAAITPGSGTWDLSTANWNNGTNNVAWVNVGGTNGSDAVFAGADGSYAVNVGQAINAVGLIFSNSGYTLSGTSAQTITLAGQLSVAGGKTATIGNNVTVTRGAAYNVQGGGTLNIDAGGVVTGTGNPLAILTRTNVLPGGTLGTTGGTGIAISVNSVLTVQGGTVAPGGLLVIANAVNSTGTVTLSSGAVSLASASGGLRVAGGSATNVTNTNAVFNLDGGVLTTPRIFTGVGASAVGTFNFNGGTLRSNASAANFFNGLTTANVRAGGAVIDTQANAITIGQALQHEAALGATADGGLRKLGSGTLTLTGANTYSGTTAVSAGALLLNATHNAAAAYTVTGGAGGGATLGGNGTVNLVPGAAVTLTSSSPAVSDLGSIAPGGTVGGIGTLTVDGGLGVVLGNNSALQVDFANSSADKVSVTGGGLIDLTSPSNTLNLTGTGTGTFVVATFGGYAGAANANLFETVLVNGNVAQTVDPGLANYALVTYNANDITVNVSVPEPGAVVGLGVGAVGMLPRRRRK